MLPCLFAQASINLDVTFNMRDMESRFAIYLHRLCVERARSSCSLSETAGMETNANISAKNDLRLSGPGRESGIDISKTFSDLVKAAYYRERETEIH